MVIHDETELVVKLPIIKKPLFEAKSHVIPNNYVEDSENENDAPMSVPVKKMRKISENKLENQVRIPNKKSKQKDQSVYPTEHSDSSKIMNEIDAEDIEELRTIYMTCMSVLSKIESKYGHLLNLNESATRKRKTTTYSNDVDDDENECQCPFNKKTVFDDDGKEITTETAPSGHICPKKSRYSQPQIHQANNNLHIEYYDQSLQLPESLQELKLILQKPQIELTYRNQVIEKARVLRQQFLNEIRFNKRSLIEKLKSNVDELLDFKGTNLSSLPGYVY